jgi:hypothetical protein
MTRPSVRWLAFLALAFLAGRGLLHVATFALPLSNDDAIPMIQAGLLCRGEMTTTLINQPYNGTLDSWLMAPALWVAGPHAVFRFYELMCAVALVGVCGWLAGKAGGPATGAAAALMAAFGSPYMALMAAVGPVPNFVVPVLVAVVLGLLWPRPEGAVAASRAGAAGVVAGLAVWDSALALPALAGALAGLACARGDIVRLRVGVGFAAGFAAGYLPAFVARAVGAAGSSTVTALRPPYLWRAGMTALAEAAAGLFGVSVPLVVDGPERQPLPLMLAVLLAIALLGAVVAGVRRSAWPLAAWGVALAGAFALSRRTGPHEVRYLYGLTVPVIVLAAVGLERVHRWRAAVAHALVLPIVLAWGFGHVIVAGQWRDPRHAADVWQVPPLSPAVAMLERDGLHSAYASLQFAGRLVVESSFGVVASQAWNERIPGDPLRFRDEVDIDPRAAWVLSPRWSRGMPRVPGFRAALQEMGGTWREETAGDVVVFHGFTPPFDEARPVPAADIDVADVSGPLLPAAVLDRDTATVWRAPVGLSPGAGLVVRVAPARRLSAVVLAVDLDHSPLGVPWAATVDGEIAARGPRRYGLQWVGGVPRAGKQALLTIVLPGRATEEVRLLFQGAGPPLAVSEVFAYGPDEVPVSAAGEVAASRALAASRAGRWQEAVAQYREAVRGEPERAAYHASLMRAERRAAGRQWLDVESLDDGGPEIVVGLR